MNDQTSRPGADALSLVEVQDAQSPLAKEALAIYEASFPVEEREPQENLGQLINLSARGPLADGTLFHFLTGVAGAEVQAMALYTYHPQQRLGFLGYMAITAVSRGQGLGSWMFQQTMARLAEEAGERPFGMCWEVQRPSDIDDPHERELAERRIRFYQRHGSILFPEVDLLTPSLGEGLPDVSYHLMYYPLDGETAVSPDRLRAMVDVILGHNYGAAPDSIYYRRALQSIRHDQSAGATS